ncbi:uncharacterized protein F5Z01DRAFT_677645 [Emericellopsis atlantica]|uniref:Prokaryotic-type class I peptide chain release factors domain-containing protein n=1 Tax=Emericellopsis atlantica TaxID=2614577 RepID=A0A9P7ZF51_9HYPO|nr:uncharacterized protein F5Z01DRAFT_677645 [Emericellopsis atlantica]KAG9250517.1 hypothetical protein F5Z01DRAFT_677645 [Emericellopsis atlantica]
MNRQFSSRAWQPLISSRSRPLWLPRGATRFKQHEAFDARLDRDTLAETRAWFAGFNEDQLPRGSTSFARSSGAGGQHVNKTETKAITVFPLYELLAILPKTLHTHVRASRYYTANNDSLTFHAQTSRSRNANMEENRDKLVAEIKRIYHANTPNETSQDKKDKYEEVSKKFHETRVKSKKVLSSKKQARRGSAD